jgi:non-specific serine/threonine protein kinase
VVSRLVLVATVVACTEPNSAPTGEPWTPTQMEQRHPALPSWADGQPVRRLETAATALGTRLVILGGIDTSDGEVPPRRITSDVLVFDPLVPEARAWSTLPPAPVAWSHANLAGYGGVLYLLGGLEGPAFEPRGEAFVLEQGAKDWVPLPAMPDGQARGASGVIVSAGHIYLIGGAGTSGVLGNTLDFDLATRTWSIAALPELPVARSHLAAMREYDGTFVVAGGSGAAGALNGTLQLPMDATEWNVMTPMQEARTGCAYGVAFGQLVCAGGDDGTRALATVESYDPRLDREGREGAWTQRPAMPEARAGSRGAVVGQRLYVPGGSASLMFQPTDTLFVFSPVDTGTAP